MEEYILNIIGEISQGKKERNVVPTAAMMSEIQNRISKDTKAILNKLCSENKLEFHKLLNDVSFERK